MATGVETCDVAIVGYGPVGQALAILLGARGWRVIALEKQPAAYPLPRAVHFDHEVGRILQQLGVADDLADTIEPADVYEWRNAAGATLLRFVSKAAGRSGWPEANMFSQPDLERLLDVRARSLPNVSVHRGHEVVDVEADADGVVLTVAFADGGAAEASAPRDARASTRVTRRIEARFAIGCDGANSTVRPHLGATVTDLGFFFDWLIVDVLPHQPKTWNPVNLQICDPARPTTLVSGGRGRRRWEFMRLPGESLDDLNRETTAWRLLEPWDVTPANATLERHTVYRFQARWVDRWRSDRLLLAGDAAHQMPPFAGQGLCSGLRDAANLAWKLDLVLAKMAPESLLDTYASERVPHVRTIVDFSMALGRVICIADPAEADARDAAMIASAGQGPASTPPPVGLGSGLLREGDARAGDLFVQGRVRRGERVGLFDEVVGRGWTLLGIAGDPAHQLDRDSLDWLRALGGAAIRITPAGDESGDGDAVIDVDGTYARWFAESGQALVLQRPDFYVFGTAPRIDGAGALVECLRAALTSGDQRATEGAVRETAQRS